MTTRHISFFGAIDDGDGIGGGTDNSAAFQDACNWLQDERGGTLDFTPTNTGWYKQLNPVTLFHQDSSSHMSYALLSGGSRIDATQMTSGTAWTIGAAGLYQLAEEGDWRIDLKLKGPEALDYDRDNPIADTNGFRFQYIINADLDGLTANGFKKGLNSTWMLYCRGNLNLRRNIIGAHLDAVSNANKFSIFGVNCKIAVALAPTQFDSNTFDKGKINGNKIEHLWAEGSDVAIWVDGGTVSGAPIVFGNEFNQMYVAQMHKSAIRLGYQLSYNTSSTVASVGQVANNKIASKFFNPPSGGYVAGKHAIDIAPGLKVTGLEIDLPVPWATSEAFNNRPVGGVYRLWESPQSNGTYLYRGVKTVSFDSSGNFTVS